MDKWNKWDDLTVIILMFGLALGYGTLAAMASVHLYNCIFG